MKTINLPTGSSKALPYSIQDYSGHSANYRPDNVRQNEPTEQASRWSSAANDQNQFLILRLDKMSILDYITFGKFHKPHVCNLKEFKVFAGPDLESLQLCLHSGLNNDTEAESFPPAQPQLPVRFIKIVPIAAWGSNFNFSIWFVELHGWDTVEVVKTAFNAYQASLQRTTTRKVLKYLRDCGHREAFESLLKATAVPLEDPIISELWKSLHAGAFEEAEALLQAQFTANPSIFDEYLHNSVPYVAKWERLDGKPNSHDLSQFLDENGDFRMAEHHLKAVEAAQPTPRGGHQMCFDPQSRSLFLLGGWDGRRDLGDFWKCSIDSCNPNWELISLDVERDGGPAACSCHKASLHGLQGEIYVLGRYIEAERRVSLDSLRNTSASASSSSSSFACPFYKYSVKAGKWTRISADVRVEGGPGCIYDHQMIIDEVEDVIWIFGGRILGSSSNSEATYSGLYRYEIKRNKWTLVRPDGPTSHINIPSRIGHSMLWDSMTRSLLILSGQRNKDYLSDFYALSVDSNSVSWLQKNLQFVGGPEGAFTQRACLDTVNREMFVFSGLMRGNSEQGENLKTSGDFWCFDLESKKWTKILMPENQPPHRFAHQICFDSVSKTHYLFGGNPGNQTDATERLGDFWRVTLHKQGSAEDVLRRCRYALKTARFRSFLPRGESLSALRFLQEDLAVVVDHANPTESAAFRALSQELFNSTANQQQPEQEDDLFSFLVQFFPKTMQPPFGKLS